MWLKKYKFECVLFLLALFGSAAVYLAMLAYHPSYWQQTDWEFQTLAQSLRDHATYTDNDGSPNHPVSGYLPLYPLLLIPLAWSQLAVFIFNWILHALIVVATFRLAKRLGASAWPAFILCALFAVEPYHLLLTNEIHAEMLLGLLLIWSVGRMISYTDVPTLKHFALGALWLGLATLTRPSAQLLWLIVLVGPALVVGLNGRALKHTLLGLGIVLLVLSPWMVRNWNLYHSLSLSSLGTQQMFNAVMPHYLEWKEKGVHATEPEINARRIALYHQAESYLGYSIETRYAIDLSEAKILKGSMVTPFLKANFPSLALFYATQYPFQLLTDNWRSGLDIVTLLPHSHTTPTSAAIAAAHGDFSQLLETFKAVDLYLLAFLAGKTYWITFYALGILGAVALWRREKKLIALGLVALVLYFPLVSLPYLEARYRFPSTPELALLAAVGLSSLVEWKGRRVLHVFRP